ncbi:MAG: carbohydrate kinase family protein [Candidatus Doudnabacteria bacterium]|nr:carbohydrate kinase family protein [Candidatus Doudnabacteria bacterium]
MFDFVVIGDIVIDRILHLSHSDIINSIDPQKHTVTLPFPNKIQLDVAPSTNAGGNAYNVATAMKKLGLNVALYSVIGNDFEGQKMLDEIKAAGVNCDLVTKDENAETNSAVILNIRGDRLVMSYHQPRKYSLPDIPDTKFVYLTSIGEDDQELFKQVLELKQKKGFKLIFSPGTLQVTEPFAEVKDVIAASDLLILNKAEAISMSRLNTESNEYLMQGLFKYGPKQIIITRSDRGSIAYDGKGFVKVGALKVTPVESTGAGDCFAASVGAAIAYEKDIATAMGWGAVNAANAICSVGATTGLLTKDELEAQYNEKVSQLVYTEATSSEIKIPKVSEHYEGS